MSGDELVRCRSCGVMFWAVRHPRGPIAGYCSPRCRQAAYRTRRHDERAAVVADRMLACTHARLAEALAALSGSSLARLQEELFATAELNLSPGSGDKLWSESTTEPGGVVAPLHKER